jgi:hypothetical protein
MSATIDVEVLEVMLIDGELRAVMRVAGKESRVLLAKVGQPGPDGTELTKASLRDIGLQILSKYGVSRFTTDAGKPAKEE